MIYLQGVTNEVILNVQRLNQFLIMGNSISIPHATICILNALRSQGRVSTNNIPKFFVAVFAKHLINMKSLGCKLCYKRCGHLSSNLTKQLTSARRSLPQLLLEELHQNHNLCLIHPTYILHDILHRHLRWWWWNSPILLLNQHRIHPTCEQATLRRHIASIRINWVSDTTLWTSHIIH